ncbi:bifunctional diaminohydroxyphosphoribosylaminopyrimidine deaminase/5-amino-6-(5-phosphoribosylamino)uracil reductase RibD [Neisseriaceae bacterium ESL0693]|nr:bifunctional diaminohydroxyphosphoribosylaminopyrimidine deaminase/5-amino-6-(5-phosphoribosylamino)uracil reductase RibD [Neisseriaceae bacterium ESL0693]
MTAVYTDDKDQQWMQLALNLAAQGRFSTSPNPHVGCVITQGEQIVGQGFHVKAGEPHAEIHALRQAGDDAQGACAYVTLEPCSHTGRTGPCARALIDAGISRVVVAMQDPNPQVSGQGLAQLQQAGINVVCGVLETQARALNSGFLSRIERNRPYVRLKVAASLDGKTALSNGQSQWITGEKSRDDVQTLRAESCAVLTGINTVLSDNPRLNVRRFPTLRQPLRIILDSRLRLTPEYQVITDSTSPTLIMTTQTQPQLLARFAAYSHVSVLSVPADEHGHIDLNRLWPLLAQRGIGLMLVEAGQKLNSALINAALVDEIIYYQAPKLLGQTTHPAFCLPENPHALQHTPWLSHSVTAMGQDCRWILRHEDSATWLNTTLDDTI